MKISKKTEYAIKLVLELSINYNKKLKIKDISKKHKIPFKFLQQLVLQLRSLGYIETYRGKDGGVILAKHPKDINLKEFIKAIEVSISPIACLDKGCSESQICVLYPILEEIKSKTEEILQRFTFKDIIKKFVSYRIKNKAYPKIHYVINKKRLTEL